MRSLQTPFRWFTLAVFLGLTLPLLVQRGMFMDGLLYLTVAHNEAHGFGTFWEPRFSQEGFAGLRTFHEHPPLAFGIESLWFRLLGSAFWVERAYCFFIALSTAALLISLWRTLWPKGDDLRHLWWLPVLLWIIVPQVHWCVQNNMQENTMSVFTVAAVLFAVLAAQGRVRPWAGHLMVGVLTFGASMVKGVPGLFPLGAPLLFGLLTGEGGWRRALLGSVMATAVVVGLYALLMTWPEARTSLTTYAEGRLLHRIDQDPTVDHRWRMLQHLVFAMLGPALLTLAVTRACRGLVPRTLAPVRNNALALVAIGLSGVLPLLLTMVQKSFYMVAALPLISVGLACWAAPGILAWASRADLGRRGKLVIGRVGQVGVAGVLAASLFLFGKPSRDADLLHDADLIGAVLPDHALVSVDDGVWEQWNLQSYLMRYHFISMKPHGTTAWYLTEGDRSAPPGYRRLPLDSRRIHLWRMEQAAGRGPGG